MYSQKRLRRSLKKTSDTEMLQHEISELLKSQNRKPFQDSYEDDVFSKNNCNIDFEEYVLYERMMAEDKMIEKSTNEYVEEMERCRKK